jgi:hypothetical protein
VRDPACPPPPGRPLTPAQTRLVQLLAQITVEEFVKEAQDAPSSDAPDDTSEERR